MSKFNDEMCEKAVKKFGIDNLQTKKKMFYFHKKIKISFVFLVIIFLLGVKILNKNSQLAQNDSIIINTNQ